MWVVQDMSTPQPPWLGPEPVLQAQHRPAGVKGGYRTCHGHLGTGQGILVAFKVPSSPNHSVTQPHPCTNISASCAALPHSWSCRHFSYRFLQSLEKFRMWGCFDNSISACRTKKCEQSSSGCLHSSSKDTGRVFSWSGFMLNLSFTSTR